MSLVEVKGETGCDGKVEAARIYGRGGREGWKGWKVENTGKQRQTACYDSWQNRFYNSRPDFMSIFLIVTLFGLVRNYFLYSIHDGKL